MAVTTAITLPLETLWAEDEIPVKPGLWEISQDIQIEGQSLPNMQEMMAMLPEEQRAQMDAMLQQHGVQMGEKGGVLACMTRESIAAGALPVQKDPDSGCETKLLEKTPSHWRFQFSCPDNTQGEGEVTFVSREYFTTHIQMGGEDMAGNMTGQARWQGSDCGDIEPMH